MKQLINSQIKLITVKKGVIYHYTKADVFKKIIRSQALHMSNYLDLKGDPDELVLPFKTYNDIVGKLYPKIIDFNKLCPDEFYVSSTCLRENNGYLWKEYANNFTGVVIGIQADALYEVYQVRSNRIHMTPMEYDPDKFIELCKECVNDRNPVAIFAPIRLPDEVSLYPREVRKKAILDKIPGYRESQKADEKVLGVITLQKGRKYQKEEEIRIVHSSDGALNKPLEIGDFKGKKKAILPLVLGDKHFINEIVITPNCALTIGAIKRHLREFDIQTNVRIIEKSEIV